MVTTDIADQRKREMLAGSCLMAHRSSTGVWSPTRIRSIQQVLRATAVAMLVMFLHMSNAAIATAQVKQIRLTEKQVEGLATSLKDMLAIANRVQGSTSDRPDPRIRSELESVARKHGFKNFAEYDDVAANILIIMARIDPKTKVFREPSVAIKKEIEEIKADRSIPEDMKKSMLEDLAEQLGAAVPVAYPRNVDLVKRYFDKIEAEERLLSATSGVADAAAAKKKDEEEALASARAHAEAKRQQEERLAAERKTAEERQMQARLVAERRAAEERAQREAESKRKVEEQARRQREATASRPAPIETEPRPGMMNAAFIGDIIATEGNHRSALECQSACQSRAGCKAFEFRKAGAICYLYRTVYRQHESKDAISGRLDPASESSPPERQHVAKAAPPPTPRGATLYESLMRRILAQKLHGTINPNDKGKDNYYRSTKPPKALAVCVDWEKSTPARLEYRGFSFAHNGPTQQDVDERALSQCYRVTNGCQCAIVDRNEGNALAFPTAWAEKHRSALQGK